MVFSAPVAESKTSWLVNTGARRAAPAVAVLSLAFAFLPVPSSYASSMRRSASTAAQKFPPSLYPSPANSRGGALSHCPSPAGLTTFGRLATDRALRMASRFNRVSLTFDLHNSDRSWWPTLRQLWRSGHFNTSPVTVERRVLPGSRDAYATIVRFSCGRTIVRRSIAITVLPTGQRFRSCSDCAATLFLIDRRGRPLVYYVQ